MKKSFILFIIFICYSTNAQGQNKDSLLNVLFNRFDSFDYEQVIALSNDLLKNRDLFENKEIIEVYRIRATAQFSVYNEDSAKSSLNEIILMDEAYTLDPIKNSPKLINLYEDLKEIFLVKKENQAMQDSLQASEIPKEPEVFYSQNDLNRANQLYRNSITRSMFLPGWGHLYLGKQNLKGAILTASSIGALGGMIYYIIDSNKKEKAYLQESNKALINSKYDSFNQSYKIRNLLIAGFSAIWLYSQIDLLYISSDNFRFSAGVLPSTNAEKDLTLLFTLAF